MVTRINRNIKIWQEDMPISLPGDNYSYDLSLEKLLFRREKVSIQRRWFNVISPSELARARNQSDGYYRVIYIQINLESGEYYIGKANRPKWSDLRRYQGSGVKFRHKFDKHWHKFRRFYIAKCDTAAQTEELEAEIVNSELLSDDKCLNLHTGGGGINRRPTKAESSQKKREYMKSHPEQYKPMLEAARKAFASGDTSQLRERNKRIKEAHSADEYRKNFRERLLRWRIENPGEYTEARQKNREKIRSAEVQAKRRASFVKWTRDNPEKFKEWQNKLIASRTTEQANQKRKNSLKKWQSENPEQAAFNAKKRSKAAAAKRSKAVCMIDLNSGEVLRTFESQREAANWLVENGIAKTKNCITSINGVCLRKRCTTGYGYRKKAYGYVWRFADEII